MTLDLTPREHMLLIELLDAAHREKLHELHHADLGDFKQYLRDRLRLIEELRAKIATAHVVTTA